MLRCTVHNTVTGQRYEFTAADQAEIDARLEQKANVYGAPAEREVTITEVDLRPERIAAAWKAADKHAASGMDANSRASLLWLAMDPACPAWRRERIQAVQAWWAAVWSHYAAVKQQINAGVDAEFDPSIPGQCPFTIWQIAGDEP
jgi:hypothetical protein